MKSLLQQSTAMHTPVCSQYPCEVQFWPAVSKAGTDLITPRLADVLEYSAVDFGRPRREQRWLHFLCHKWQNKPVQFIHLRWYRSEKAKVLIMKALSLPDVQNNLFIHVHHCEYSWSEHSGGAKQALLCHLGYFATVPVELRPSAQSGKGVSIHQSWRLCWLKSTNFISIKIIKYTFCLDHWLFWWCANNLSLKTMTGFLETLNH